MRRDRTKEYLTTALFLLMEEKPFTQISVTEIADKAGVGRASFYRKFDSKEDVVEQALADSDLLEHDSLGHMPASLEDFRELAIAVFLAVKRNRRRIELLIDAHLEHLLLSYANDMVMGRHVPPGKTEPTDSERYFAYGYAGAICNIILTWVSDGCATPVDQMADVMTGIIFPQGNAQERIDCLLARDGQG